jgi:hypothetical protein
MLSRSWTKIVGAVLLAGLCIFVVPVRAGATPLDELAVGGVPAAKLWTVALDWLHAILPGGGDPTVIPGPPKFGAGQSSDGRTKSGRMLASQAQ